jgi:hypothetical protein
MFQSYCYLCCLKKHTCRCVQIVSVHLGKCLVVRALPVVMVKVHILVFWGMELCSLVGGYWHFCRCTFRL